MVILEHPLERVSKPSCWRGANARRWALLLGIASVLLSPLGSHAAERPAVDYKPNKTETTSYGPAYADIVLHPSNFVPCYGGPIALCYYSGPTPEDGQADLSCEVTDDKEFSNCRCVEIPAPGLYYVDINGILDKEVYNATVKKCGKSGADCKEPNKAPVCEAIRTKQLLSDAEPPPDTISTFSLALNSVPGYEIGQTNCPPAGESLVPYAGCMTAPCVQTGETGKFCFQQGEGNEEVLVCKELPINICTCPNFTGPYQVGGADATCEIGLGAPGENIWSAAYNPTVEKISQLPCVPDLFGSSGCPLLSPLLGSNPKAPEIPEKPKDISCGKVCAEYRSNVRNGIEVGFTCDATVCTVSSIKDDPLLVAEACSGLGDGKKGISEILKLEAEIGCSCCASQICGCEPSQETNEKIYVLNAEQRAQDIDPQCDYNGSLCGAP